MNRREFVSGLGATVAGATVADAYAAVKAKAPKKPNLIYVFADQLRYSPAATRATSTPARRNMDRLAEQGCNLHQAVSSTPVCAPYRASLMTGKYQSSTGMVINEIRLSPEHRCFGACADGRWLPHRLHRQMAHVGQPAWPPRTGEERLHAARAVPPRLRWLLGRLQLQSLLLPLALLPATMPKPHIRGRVTSRTARPTMAIDFVKRGRKKDEPFALFLSWGPPHYPWGLDNVDARWSEQFRDVDIPLHRTTPPVADPVRRRLAEAAAELRREGP